MEILHLAYPQAHVDDRVLFDDDPSIDFTLATANLSSDMTFASQSLGASPDVFLINSSADGLVTLGWTDLMEPVPDINALFSERIAVLVPHGGDQSDESFILVNRS